MKVIKKEIEFKLGQPLIEGKEYVVLYKDCHHGEERKVNAMVVDGKLKYDYRFVMDGVEPTFEYTKGHHLILGVFNVSDWGEA